MFSWNVLWSTALMVTVVPVAFRKSATSASRCLAKVVPLSLEPKRDGARPRRRATLVASAAACRQQTGQADTGADPERPPQQGAAADALRRDGRRDEPCEVLGLGLRT